MSIPHPLVAHVNLDHRPSEEETEKHATTLRKDIGALCARLKQPVPSTIAVEVKEVSQRVFVAGIPQMRQSWQIVARG